MKRKLVALSLALLMLVSTIAVAEDELVSLLGFEIGTETHVLTGWVGDVWAKKGLKLESIDPSGAALAEKMQTMLASGDLPDLVRFSTWDYFSLAVEAGYLVNLDEHLDKLPNTVKYAADALEYVRDFRSNGTGKAYGIPDNVGPNTFDTDAGCYAFNVRWDIYAQAGYPEAETLEDMIDVFLAMKEVYPKNEDGLETYALNTFGDWDGTSRFAFANAVMTVLGYLEGMQSYLLDYHIPTGATNSIFEDDSTFLRAIKFLYSLNQAGLMDPDTMSQTYAVAEAKIANGQYFGAWWGGYPDTAFNTLEKLNSDPPVGFAPVFFDEYIASTMGHYPIGTHRPLTISANTEYLDACLTYVDANADPEFLYELYHGPKGVFWDIDADGKTYATDAFYTYTDTGTYTLESGEEYTYLNGRYTLLNSFLTTFGPIDGTFEQQSRDYRFANNLMTAWSEHYGGEYAFPIDKIYAEDRLALRPLAWVSFMPQMSDDMQMTRNSVMAVVQTNCWKMVYAADEAEFYALWEATKADADALGAAEVQTWALEAFENAFEMAAKYE